MQAPDGGKETWTLLYDLICHELCQPDDPPIIVQEQKTVLASVLSVLSAIFASQTEQEYIKMRKSKSCVFVVVPFAILMLLQLTRWSGRWLINCCLVIGQFRTCNSDACLNTVRLLSGKSENHR